MVRRVWGRAPQRCEHIFLHPNEQGQSVVVISLGNQRSCLYACEDGPCLDRIAITLIIMATSVACRELQWRQRTARGDMAVETIERGGDHSDEGKNEGKRTELG